MNGNFSTANDTNIKSEYFARPETPQRRDLSPTTVPNRYSQRQVQPINQGNMETAVPRASFTPAPVTLESADYMAGLLTTLVGETVRVQFLIGTTGPLIDILGTLIQVGANYIVIQPITTDDFIICDLYTIKFVTVLR